MRSNRKSDEPWLDKNGKLIADRYLKEISKNWDTETWERFLVVTVEGNKSYQRESLISAYAYDCALDEMSQTIWECMDSPEPKDICELTRRLCRDHLTPKQQQVIRLIYWEGLSLSEIARMLMLDRSTVEGHKVAALNKIKFLYEKKAALFPQYERDYRKDPIQKGLRYEDLQSVYQEEISGNQFGKFRGGK